MWKYKIWATIVKVAYVTACDFDRISDIPMGWLL